ncbi:hypothetical protein AGMMS4952_18520 [Spirochaetia bacterium]|nr:hypothetical protein AGMMS4952_18520 [Spirochaetia bacterium]
MLTLTTTARYRKEYKLAIRRGLDITLLDAVIQTLLEEKPLGREHIPTFLVKKICRNNGKWQRKGRSAFVSLI